MKLLHLNISCLADIFATLSDTVQFYGAGSSTDVKPAFAGSTAALLKVRMGYKSFTSAPRSARVLPYLGKATGRSKLFYLGFSGFRLSSLPSYWQFIL